MMWESISMMTGIDIAIVGAVGYSLWVFYHQIRNLPRSTISFGVSALVLGLSSIALFYLFDLATMHVLPLFMPMSKAMAIMEDLHLNYHWIMTLFAVVALAVGFGTFGRGVFAVIDKLHESEGLLRTVLDNLPVGVSFKDEQGRYKLINKQFETWYGFTNDEARGRAPDELLDEAPQTRAARDRHEREVVESGMVVTREGEKRRVDGTSHSIIIQKFPVVDSHGKITSFGTVITDITGRKRAEKEIAEKSALLDTTFESMSQGVSVYDADIKLAAFNQQIIDVMDFPPGFLRLGMPYEEIARFKAERGDYGPGDVDEHVRKRVLNRRERKPSRKERTWPNGRVTLMRRDVLPDGGYVSTHTDITERKRAEKALQKAHDVLESRVRERTKKLRDVNRKLKSEIADRKRGQEELTGKSELLMATFDNMSQGIRVLDKELKVAAFNQKYIELMAFPPGLVRVGIPLEELARFKAERGDHGPVDVEEFVNNRVLVRRRGKSEVYQYDELPNGLTVLCQHNLMPDGGFVATYTDVTKREKMASALHKTNQRYRQLLESTNAIPWEADAKTWMFTYVGPQAVELLGYPRELWLEKDFWVEHIHPEDRAKTIDDCLKSSAQRENYVFDYRMLAADGRSVWLHDIVNVVKQEGEPVSLRGFMLDITERKSLEDLQRNTSGRLINAQEEERRKIARELHDDFGQRLALLAIGIQGLGQKISQPGIEGAKSLDKLWSQTRKLSTDLHRLSHQLHPAILHQLGLGPAIRSLCNEISEQHGIEIKFTEHEVPASISEDIALCLYRTVQEGVRNIVKHSGAKDAKVELTGGPDTIHLRIADRGVGFDPETPKGKGIGLVSIEERVRLVQGEMSLQSRPSHGTCIDLRIPSATPDTWQHRPALHHR